MTSKIKIEIKIKSKSKIRICGRGGYTKVEQVSKLAGSLGGNDE